MARHSHLPPAQRVDLVLAVLRGTEKLEVLARRHQVSTNTLPYGPNIRPPLRRLSRSASGGRKRQISVAPRSASRHGSMRGRPPEPRGIAAETRSCRAAVVVAQHPAEALAADDFAFLAADFFSGLDQLVLQALMIPLAMIVRAERVDGSA